MVDKVFLTSVDGCTWSREEGGGRGWKNREGALDGARRTVMVKEEREGGCPFSGLILINSVKCASSNSNCLVDRRASAMRESMAAGSGLRLSC